MKCQLIGAPTSYLFLQHNNTLTGIVNKRKDIDDRLDCASEKNAFSQQMQDRLITFASNSAQGCFFHVIFCIFYDFLKPKYLLSLRIKDVLFLV